MGSAAFATVLATALASGVPSTPEPCELHVWGAVKTFAPSSKFAAVAARKGTYHADRSNPVANINALNPVVRLRGVPDSAFHGFFGANVPVSVIRHDKALDLKRAKKARSPLSRRKANCHGDLVVSNLFDIEWPSGGPDTSRIGIIEGVLMAPAGMNMQITFLRFDRDGGLDYRTRDGVNGALLVRRAQWPIDPQATVRMLDRSVEAGIRAFGVEHLGIASRDEAASSAD